MTKTTFPVVRLERTIPAPPPDVYRAWLEPQLLRQWMAPGLEVTRVEVEARVGGRFRIRHADAGEEVGGFEGEIVELIADQRIVFRWGFAGPHGADGPVYDSRLTVTLEPAHGNATLLRLVHERLDDLATAMPGVAKNVELGWKIVLEKLGALVGRADRAAPSPNQSAEEA